MGRFLFYFLNFISITIYYLFNRRENPDSMLFMTPYVLGAIIIFLAISKTLARQKLHSSRDLLQTFFAGTFAGLLVFLNSCYSLDPGLFDINACLNSLRRYFGTIFMFYAILSIDRLFGLDRIKLRSYLKFIVALVGGEAIIEFILLNTGVISLSNLPIILGAEALFDRSSAFRPYGFLGSTTALGVFLLMLFYLCRGHKQRLSIWSSMLSFIGFAVTLSVTAYSIFGIVSAFSIMRNKRGTSWVFSAVGFAVVFALLTFGLSILVPEKMTIEYFREVMVENWGMNWNNYVRLIKSPLDILIGAQLFDIHFGVISQDLPYVTWLSEVGLVGLLTYAWITIHYMWKLNAEIETHYVLASIGCIFLGMLHYPIIIFIPMQIFMGSLLFFASRMDSRKNSKYNRTSGEPIKELRFANDPKK